MLEEKITYDFSMTENGCINPRRITTVLKDGKFLTRVYNRLNGAIAPGGPIPEELPDHIKSAIQEIWTDEVINDYKLMINDQR